MKKWRVLVLIGLFYALMFSISSFAEGLPSYKVVCKNITDIPNWTGSECSGMNESGTPMGDIVTASRDYEKKDKAFHVSVISGMQAMASWMPFATNINIETDENVVKTLTIQDYRAGLSYDKKEKSGGIFICLKTENNQCKVIFGTSFENMKYEDALDLIKNFDLKSISGIF